MFRLRLIAAAVALPVTLCAPLATPAHAAIDNQEPGRFITTLSADGFATLRTANKAAARDKFRTLLSQYFAVDEIGDKLIRRWRPTITPSQYSAYKAALPGFLIGTYADRLYDYANASVKVMRVVPAGASAVVQSQVIRGGGQPMIATWTVQKIGGGYKVSNLQVAGINLTLTQTQDFDSYVQRNGFDKLVAFMKSRG